jgi:hypothetical protein
MYVHDIARRVPAAAAAARQPQAARPHPCTTALNPSPQPIAYGRRPGPSAVASLNAHSSQPQPHAPAIPAPMQPRPPAAPHQAASLHPSTTRVPLQPRPHTSAISMQLATPHRCPPNPQHLPNSSTLTSQTRSPNSSPPWRKGPAACAAGRRSPASRQNAGTYTHTCARVCVCVNMCVCVCVCVCVCERACVCAERAGGGIIGRGSDLPNKQSQPPCLAGPVRGETQRSLNTRPRAHSRNCCFNTNPRASPTNLDQQAVKPCGPEAPRRPGCRACGVCMADLTFWK